MSRTTPAPISKLLYGAFMLVYPRGFRSHYRHALTEAFCAQRGDPRYGRGIRGTCLFWWDVVMDLVRSVPQCWMRALNELREHRDATKGRTVDHLLRETKYAVRALLARPAFALTAGATLALGIGLTTAMFSIVDGVLMKPLPYPEPERIVRLWDSHEEVPFFSVTVSNFFDWRNETESFAALGAYRENGLNLVVNGEPQRRPGAQVTAGLLPVLGVEPELGRFFLEEEDRPGAAPVVILTYGLWQSRFGGRSDILGDTLTISGAPATIVGVLPARFRFPQHPNVELLVPYGLSEEQGSRRAHFLRVLGRVRYGVSVDEAEAELQTLAIRLAQQYPETNAGWSVAMLPLHEAVVGTVGPALRFLLIAVGLVLLICCVNVANLFLARTSARTGELALRSALGASRGRLLTQLLTESFVLVFFGAVGALAIAQAVTTLLPHVLPASIPRQQDITLDFRVLAFSLGLATVSGLLACLVPAMRGAGHALAASARAGSRATTRLPRIFVAAEVALALTLLVGSAVLLRSFAELSRVDPGFDVSRGLAMDVTPVDASYPEPAARGRLFRELVSGIEALPAVDSAAIVHRLPLSGNSGFPVFVEGRTYDAGVAPSINYRAISNHYFETLGMTLMQGRSFTDDETWESGGVAVVNQTMAATLWPDGDVIGARIAPRIAGPWAEVVGIVSDARESGLDQDPEAAMYFPHAHAPIPMMTLVVRTTAARPETMILAVQEVFSRVDPGQPVSNFRTLEMHVDNELAATKFRTLLLTLFAVASLALAAVGIHGVTTIAVRERTREIGIRIALGARAGDVVRMVVTQGLTPVLLGLGVGLVGAFVLTSALEGLVYGVSPADPLSFFALPALLLGVAFAASLLPARRAASIDPNDTLRTE